MGNKESRPADAHEPARDSSEDDGRVLAARELERLSQYPARTAALCRAYNRHFAMFIVQSRYHALTMTAGRLRFTRYCKLGASPIDISKSSVKYAPDGLNWEVAVLSPILSNRARAACVKLTWLAYKLFGACGLITHIAVALSHHAHVYLTPPTPNNLNPKPAFLLNIALRFFAQEQLLRCMSACIESCVQLGHHKGARSTSRPR
jgi:hypothetical protein